MTVRSTSPPNEFNGLVASETLKLFVPIRKVLKTLNTIVCGVICAVLFGHSAMAQGVHPEIGDKPPREMLNRDLLQLPERDWQAWIHGAVAQMAQVIAGRDAISARCVMDWYFETGVGADSIPETMKSFPDAPSTATIYTLARRVCPDA